MSTTYKAVPAEEVAVGDLIFNNLEKNPRFQWSRVLEVSASNDGYYVVLKTSGYETWKHPKEAVVVGRGA